MSRRPQQPMLLFLHIPRTAGTTLNRALRLKHESKRELLVSAFRGHRPWREFVRDVQSLPPRKLRRVRYYRDHFSYGIHALLPKPAIYVSMVRDPVARVLSTYLYFIRQYGSDDVSIEDFVRKGREGDPRLHIGWTDNVQVRMLAGHEGKPVKAPIGSCTTDMLELAKERIESSFVLLGLTERFDESVLLLKKKLGWRTLNYVTFNASKVGSRPQEISETTLDLIRSYNELDSELYAFAARRLESHIQEAGPSFPEDLERFRTRNRLFSKVAEPIFRGSVRWSRLGSGPRRKKACTR